jgi:uncharacterized protein
VELVAPVRQRRRLRRRPTPQFDTDIGFYVFKLPFLSFGGRLAVRVALIVLIVTVAAHYLNGGIRVQPAGPGAKRVTPQVKAHLSVLLGVLALSRRAATGCSASS